MDLDEQEFSREHRADLGLPTYLTILDQMKERRGRALDVGDEAFQRAEQDRERLIAMATEQLSEVESWDS